jgi:hypothetical protein
MPVSWEKMEAARLRMLSARSALESYSNRPRPRIEQEDVELQKLLFSDLNNATSRYLELVARFIKEQPIYNSQSHGRNRVPRTKEIENQFRWPN